MSFLMTLITSAFFSVFISVNIALTYHIDFHIFIFIIFKSMCQLILVQLLTFKVRLYISCSLSKLYYIKLFSNLHCIIELFRLLKIDIVIGFAFKSSHIKT